MLANTAGFAGRALELKKLEGLYGSGKFECVAMHGRWRVGKTALLREFLKDKDKIYFSAQETCARENFEYLSRCVSSYLHDGAAQDCGFTCFEDILKRICDISESNRLVLVIDDYQYLAASHRGFSGLLCDFIELRLKSSRLMLIICGSSGPLMESEVLGWNSPFHGKRTAQITLSPFTFFEVRSYYGIFSPYDVAVLHGVTGGVPAYLELMDPGLPIEENIRRMFLDPESRLFDETSNYLRREVRDPVYYNAVLRAIATGSSKNSEIAAATGLESSACTAYLKNLIALGLVGKYTPVTEKAGKKTIYEISDNFFRFRYRFVPGNMSLIQGGASDRIWRNVAREIPLFMGKVFEDICREWMEQRNRAGQLPAKFDEVGRWWGIDPAWKREVSIPIVAYEGDGCAAFGDCVWADDPAGVDALDALVERGNIFRFGAKHYYLFSRSGFSDECAQLARRIGANLVMFE